MNNAVLALDWLWGNILHLYRFIAQFYGLVSLHCPVRLDASCLSSGRSQQHSPAQGQLRFGCQHLDLAAVLRQAAQSRFLKAAMLLDHSEWVLNLGADVSLGSLNQLL